MLVSCRSVWTAIYLLATWLTLLVVTVNFGDVVRDVVNVSGISINRNLSTSTYLISGLVTDDGTRCYGDAQYQRAFREGECYESTVGTYQTIFLLRSLLYQSRLVSVQVRSIRLALVNNDLFAIVDEITAMGNYLGIDYQFISLNMPKSKFGKSFLDGIEVYLSVALATDGSYNGCATEWGQHLVTEAKQKGNFTASSAVTSPYNVTTNRTDSVKLDVSSVAVDVYNDALVKAGLQKIAIPVSDLGSQIASKRREVAKLTDEVTNTSDQVNFLKELVENINLESELLPRIN